MRKTNQLKIGVMLSYVSMIVQNIITIVYTPVMLRLLGQNEYGLYQLVYSVVSYLGLLNFGFGRISRPRCAAADTRVGGNAQ